jgi:hypothetical protein
MKILVEEENPRCGIKASNTESDDKESKAP